MVRRRAKPPSPSPSITRRRTPAALATGVHPFLTMLERRSLSSAVSALRAGTTARIGG